MASDFNKLLLDEISDAVVVKTTEGRVVYWNHGAEDIFGYARDEAIGHLVGELIIPPDRMEEETVILRGVATKNLPPYKSIRRKKDGSLIDVDVSSKAIRNEDGEVEYVLSTSKDVTHLQAFRDDVALETVANQRPTELSHEQLVAELERKNSELTAHNEEKRSSEQNLLLLGTALETTANAVVITDTKGIILWVNPAFTTLTGYTSEEVLGKTPRLLKSGKHDREFYKNLWATILTGKTWRGSFTNRRKDGTLYYDEHTITPVRSRNGAVAYFIAIMNDVTERVEVEGQLVWKTAFLEAQIDSALDGILIVDGEGKMLIQNQRMIDLWHIPQKIADAVDDRPRLEWVINQVKNPQLFAEKVFYLYEHPVEISQDELELLNGKFLDRYSSPVRGKDGKYYGRIWTFRDITERKQAELKIAEQAAFLDEAREAIVVRDLEGKILYWNKGAERMYGWTREEAMGRNIVELLYVDHTKFEEINGITISQSEWNGELQHLTKDKRKLAVESRCTLIRDNDGQPKSVLAINADITEKKKIEAQFLRAQRMESIGTLAGGVAHDLNNILAPIMMSIDILESTATDPQAQQILETIKVSAKRGADIVRQVLSFARGMEGERIEVQPKHLLRDLENIIKDTFPKDIRLQFTIPKDIWTIWGDPTQVHQILLNLCVNARDAMVNGGQLAVSVENSEIDAQYAAMNIKAKVGRYVKISVADSGTGIAPEVLDKIFEPFFTTKELNKGTGLGLSTVMAIVKSHEGIVNVYSEVGKGTTFNVYLPVTELSPDAQKAPTQRVGLQRGNGETVLVVDDEASILTITGQTLQAFGYRVLTATDGATAVATYAEHKNEIAVVLTDMAMPIMDGSAMIIALKRINPAIKIIAASGLHSNGGVAKASDASVNHFLTKPYTARTLLKTVREILDQA